MNKRLPHTLDMIRALVKQPSVSSAQPELNMSNLGVIEPLAQWLDDLGFSVEIQQLTEQPVKANLIATLGSGTDGLVLSGHTDTVPWDDSGWSLDPFAGVVRDERIYGLGCCDMKGFLALMVQAAAEFNANTLKRPLILVATADEESSMMGARALLQARKPQARYAVIGEPTELVPVRMHKGVMMERIHLTGLSGHSSDPTLGRNALEGMHRVISALLELRTELQTRYRHPGFAVPMPTLNLGHIHGGDNPNRICGQCELHFDLRPLPGMDPDELRARLRTCAEQAIADSGLTLTYESLFAGLPPMETPADSAIVQAAEQLTGASARAVNFGTEGPYFNALGLETIILGPGSIAQAHQPDEYLALDRIPATLDLLRALIQRFCRN